MNIFQQVFASVDPKSYQLVKTAEKLNENKQNKEETSKVVSKIALNSKSNRPKPLQSKNEESNALKPRIEFKKPAQQLRPNKAATKIPKPNSISQKNKKQTNLIQKGIKQTVQVTNEESKKEQQIVQLNKKEQNQTQEIAQLTASNNDNKVQEVAKLTVSNNDNKVQEIAQLTVSNNDNKVQEVTQLTVSNNDNTQEDVTNNKQILENTINDTQTAKGIEMNKEQLVVQKKDMETQPEVQNVDVVQEIIIQEDKTQIQTEQTVQVEKEDILLQDVTSQTQTTNNVKEESTQVQEPLSNPSQTVPGDKVFQEQGTQTQKLNFSPELIEPNQNKDTTKDDESVPQNNTIQEKPKHITFNPEQINQAINASKAMEGLRKSEKSQLGNFSKIPNPIKSAKNTPGNKTMKSEIPVFRSSRQSNRDKKESNINIEIKQVKNVKREAPSKKIKTLSKEEAMAEINELQQKYKEMQKSMEDINHEYERVDSQNQKLKDRNIELELEIQRLKDAAKETNARYIEMKHDFESRSKEREASWEFRVKELSLEYEVLTQH